MAHADQLIHFFASEFVGRTTGSEIVSFEIALESHGGQFSQDAGLIAVVESGAEYMNKV